MGDLFHNMVMESRPGGLTLIRANTLKDEKKKKSNDGTSQGMSSRHRKKSGMLQKEKEGKSMKH